MWLNTRFSSPDKPLVLVKNKKHSNAMRKHSRYDFFFGNRPKDQLARRASQAFKQANGQEEIESILPSSRIRNNRFSLSCCDFLSIIELRRSNQEWTSIHFLKLKEPLDEDGSQVRWVDACSWNWYVTYVTSKLISSSKVSSDSNSVHMIFKRTHGESWGVILVKKHCILSAKEH